jgi:hypothetical protein
MDALDRIKHPRRNDDASVSGNRADENILPTPLLAIVNLDLLAIGWMPWITNHGR